ncbi:hypothetical protein EZM97_03725 [Dyella soli]|uniref:Uncharacterized protein n=2 Tax=Dyella TaxID=231454 RepID=A0A4R0YZI1_9GAMM|nr:hypothetical protein [Dyella soli]TCI12468.1 hypothetical protein EZM97_03725 [Dyella soli]
MRNDLQRHQYLVGLLPQLSTTDRITALQLYAALDNELGLYNEALRDFPFNNRNAPHVDLPQPDQWQLADAADVVTRLAHGRRLVLINEAHHDAHTRELTLELLPRLRAEGFTHFAAEALTDDDPDLAQRGYPVNRTGSEYLHEPLYGQIIRRALQLGFIVVPYESEAPSLSAREAEQARNLYRRVLRDNPGARLFVHGGYAHIDKAAGNLGGQVQPMAVVLKQLSGIDPLTVDQSRWRDIGDLAGDDAYTHLLSAYSPQRPSVLVRRDTGAAWSSDPLRHDVEVILPPAGNQRRPRWLDLGGQRSTRPISSDLCGRHLPCVVEARFSNESEDAIAADRYTFLRPDITASLYLWPGDYRLTAWSADGHVWTRRDFTVPPIHPDEAGH